MCFKIAIPEVSKDYKKALLTFLMNFPKDQRDNFYQYLNIISGYCQNVEISTCMSGMGGVLSVEELISKSSGFELATIKEFITFHKEGYSGGDFQHIFLNMFLSIRTDMLLTSK